MMDMPAALASMGPLIFNGPSVDPDFPAGIGLVGAGKNLHQGRLAGPVFLPSAHGFRPGDGEPHVLQRFHTRKSLGNIPHFQHGRSRRRRVRRKTVLLSHRRSPPAALFGAKTAAQVWGAAQCHVNRLFGLGRYVETPLDSKLNYTVRSSLPMKIRTHETADLPDRNRLSKIDIQHSC